ncbi:hypothetical protein EZH22_04720 [Xanthobacter dioxanivorans]|uniref:Uncharacterized protein n=1 Tax=Xanthobacter dioxanivorans TaxID=2528964 RepID=A0A974PQ61_9HYPH|nr:hypothetical protein [Xanthobacter dioxanivorans]QRG07697.1 hypothetical protein EZH22_04720 [Xanthobacter dioxanivorans]
MSIIRVLVPALLAVAFLFAAVTHPIETFHVIGSIVLTLSTASSIVFFAFVLISATIGLERHSGRHLAPAAAVHVHRSLRDDVV